MRSTWRFIAKSHFEFKMKTITRNELYSLMWSTTMKKIGAELNVPAVDIPKVCAAYNIPRPPSGYWSQLKYKKQPPRPPLEGLEETIDLSPWFVRPKGGRTGTNSVLKEPYRPKPGVHPYIEELRNNIHLKKGRTERKYHVNMYVSSGLVKRSLEIINQVLLHAADHGFNIESNEYSMWIVKGHYRGELIIREGYNRVKKENPKFWDTEIKVPNGILYLKIGEGYRSRQYRDKKSASIEEQIDGILDKLSEEIEYDLERRKRYEEERQQKLEAYLKLKEKRDRINAELIRFREMQLEVDRYQKMKKMREYLSALRNKTNKNESDQEWLSWCEHAIDWYDPSILRSHPILDFANRSNLTVKVLDRELEQWGTYNKDLTWGYLY
jgi:hypothetical protein